MQNSNRLAGLILICCVAATHGQTTQPALSMKVSASGDLAVSMGDKPVAAGHWNLISSDWQASNANQIPVGTLISSAGVQDSPTYAVVTDTFTSAKAICDIHLDGEDLRLSAHVQNLDQTHSLKKLTFRGPVFQFDRSPEGSLSSWHWSYLQHEGMSLFHPGLRSPLGVLYAHDDQFGIGIYSNSEFDRASLINAAWAQQVGVPAHCEIEFFTDRVLSPGESGDVDISFRISRDMATRHLMEDYKKAYSQHFPTPLFHADPRPVAQFASEGVQFISRTNPCGFNGGFRRLDSPIGVGAYVHLIAPPLHEANALGIIFWSPGGWIPPMYPPDFDQFPPSVQANIPKLVAGFKRYGLRVGLCARCGDGITREPGKEPVMRRLHADDPAEMKTLLDRFRHAMDMGFDLFYLDSFGVDGQNDMAILKQVRAAVGPDVLLYTEFCTDMSLPYADHYCEWVKGSIMWSTPEQFDALRYLSPNSTWLCISRDGRPVPPEFGRLGLTPLVEDQQSNRLPASQPAP